VIPAIAEPALVARERHHGLREALSLRVRPERFRFVQHRDIGRIVEPQERRSPRSAHADRNRDHDPPEPGQECGRLVEVPQTAKRHEIGVLDGVLGEPCNTLEATANAIVWVAATIRLNASRSPAFARTTSVVSGSTVSPSL
jgi:hypothetical protein